MSFIMQLCISHYDVKRFITYKRGNLGGVRVVGYKH